MDKRGQAAMEFLMTYGWALLVVLVAIGALAFFGVLDPGRFLPASCTLFPGLGCIDFKVNTTDVTLVIQNGLGDSVDISNIVMTGPAVTCSGVDPANLVDGDQITIEIPCSTLPSLGSKVKGTIEISYSVGTGSLTHYKEGSITSSIET